MILRIGELGGWVSRPGKTEMPGPKTTWIGRPETEHNRPKKKIRIERGDFYENQWSMTPFFHSS